MSGDAAILMNPQTWVASGHLGNFSDPLMDCKECHERFRADKLIEDYMQEHGMEIKDLWMHGPKKRWKASSMSMMLYAQLVERRTLQRSVSST